MSFIHVLGGRSDLTYECILHIPIPVGNNPAGIPWRSALLNSGLGGRTRMVEGTGPGQITSAEKAQIAAGELFEEVLQFQDNTLWTMVERLDALNSAATRRRAETLRDLQTTLKYFGATR